MNRRNLYETEPKITTWPLPNQEQTGTDRTKRKLSFFIRQPQICDRIARQKWCYLLHVGTLKRLRVLWSLSLGIVQTSVGRECRGEKILPWQRFILPLQSTCSETAECDSGTAYFCRSNSSFCRRTIASTGQWPLALWPKQPAQSAELS